VKISPRNTRTASGNAKAVATTSRRKYCIHCHNIYDGWRNTAYDQDTFTTEDLWVYPLPENIGLKIKVDEGNLIESILSNSPGDGLDLKAGDRIQTANDQFVISVADLQWVLDSLPSESELHLEAKREGVILKRTISLSDDWRIANPR